MCDSLENRGERKVVREKQIQYSLGQPHLVFSVASVSLVTSGQ